MRWLPLVICSFAAPALAQESPQPTRFHTALRAPADCAGRGGFDAGVTARTPLAVVASGEAAELHATVEVVAEEGGHRGRLRMRWQDGTEASRDVSATSCGEVLEALAFVVALAIDPRAQAEPTPSSTALPKAQPDEPVPAPPRPATSTTTTTQQRAEPPSVVRASPPAPADAAFDAWIGVGAELDSGSMAPGPVLGLRLGATLSQWVTPRMAAELDGALLRRSGLAELDAAQAQFTLLAGRLAPCVFLRLGSAVGARACAGAELGSLQTEPTGVAAPRPDSRLWLAGVAGGGLRFSVWNVLALGLDANAVLPTRRDRFVFLDRTAQRDLEVFSVPALAGQGVVTLAARLP
ncbi:MAG: hypothetical protein R3B13_09120 [Polyangiaceae bacterium]